jgi:hypothetical protein
MYIGECEGYFDGLINPTLYATSEDGIEWEKLLVGTPASTKVAKHNAVAGMTSVIQSNGPPDSRLPKPGISQ